MVNIQTSGPVLQSLGHHNCIAGYPVMLPSTLFTMLALIKQLYTQYTGQHLASQQCSKGAATHLALRDGRHTQRCHLQHPAAEDVPELRLQCRAHIWKHKRVLGLPSVKFGRFSGHS